MACRLLLVLLAGATLAGCPIRDRGFNDGLGELEPVMQPTPRISGFLTLKDPRGPAIRLEIAKIEVLAEDRWLPLTSGPLTLDSASIGAGQRFLGAKALPPGLYRRLRLEVTQGALMKADGEYAVIASKPFVVEVDLADDLELGEEDSRCLLLNWDVEKSLGPGNRLRPVLSATPPLRQLPDDLVFAACPTIDTVFVVRADKNWVIDSFGLKGGPTYLALDPEPASQRLYVLAIRERMIKVVNLSTYRVVDFFSVPLNDSPTFMTIGPDGREAFLLDERSGYLTRMDLLAGTSLARVQLGYRPNYMVYLEEQNLLAVSLGLSQEVVLLDPVSLRVVKRISSGSSPRGLAVADGQLFIAEYGDNTVSVVDLDAGDSQSRLSVGFGPSRLQETDTQIYVSNYLDGSLSVLVPGQLGVTQEIYGLGRPREMAVNEFYRRLYVGDEDMAALAVIDVNSNRLLGNIALGAKPLGLAVIQ